MIPDTAGAVIAFLVLVAPGIAFYLVRDRYTPARTLTTFREASVVALTSLVFTSLAAAALLALANTSVGSALPDLGAWAAQGDAYFDEHVTVAVVGLAAQVLLATLLAGIGARLVSWGSAGNISGVGTWFQVFREDRPKRTTPWLKAELEDDSIVYGYLKHYTTDTSFEDGELTVVGPKLTTQKKGGQPRELTTWYTVVIPGKRIRVLSLVYVDDRTGMRVGARMPRAHFRRRNNPGGGTRGATP